MTTSGTIKNPSLQTTTYILGKSDATLSVSTTYINTELQNLASTSCTTTPIHVYDNRDGHVYTVKRLLDGKCWMMENLDLGRTALTTDLTSANTNLDTTVTASTFNSWKKTSFVLSYGSGEFIPVTGVDANNGLAYGTLYNYYAASAGTISGSDANDAAYDICPAGWRLPTGGSTGDFKTLYDNYNSYDLFTASFFDNGASFVHAGEVNYDTPSYQDREGHYWSSTHYSSTNSNTRKYELYFYPSYSRVIYTSYRESDNGCSIRCVMK